MNNGAWRPGKRRKYQGSNQRRRTIMATKKRGFKAVQKSITKKDDVSTKSAGAILASSSRNASPAAKAKNPRLKKVKG
jgi:hypothetical protein